jgi:hypothetical protein
MTASSPSMMEETMDFLRRGMKWLWRLRRISGRVSAPVDWTVCGLLSLAPAAKGVQDVMFNEGAFMTTAGVLRVQGSQCQLG